ncbi:MAG: sel1 repeat family protein [Alphaproteobacteria bacterium]|nr:sel1 repeat family protein [Alphaproteobacteria bacterium]
MKKLLFLTLLATLVLHQANAQDADLVTAFMGEDVVEQPKDDNASIFSFLNFSFIKKPLGLLSSDKKQDVKEAPKEKAEPEQPLETPLQKAIRLADGGDAESALTLGYMYLYGQDGVQSDYAKAFHYYEIAANQNNVIALNNLGSLYFNGIGVDTDYEKAAALFQKAADLGSDDAAVNLAFIYLSTQDKNYFEPAVLLFEQAAKAGNNTAKFMLGYAYYKGFSVPQDFHVAVDLIKEAAKANFDEAEYVFARIYRNGEGITQNYSNAVKYYRKAIAQGNVEAMMELAQIYQEGIIAPKNLIQAHTLYNIASVYGQAGAAENRNAIGPKLKLEELLEAQNAAERYHANPSELTTYIRKTFGSNVRKYIDENLSKQKKQH